MNTPVLFRNGEADVAEALRAGADDYPVKPMRRLELLARLDAVARRSTREPVRMDVFRIEEFEVDVSMRRILRNQFALELTSKNFDLAVLLLRNVWRLLSRSHIRESVLGASQELNSRTLDAHVSRVRNKLALPPEHRWSLTAVYGRGAASFLFVLT